MESNPLVRHVIRSAHRRRAGVVVIELPEGQGTVSLRPALYFNDSRWPEVCPGEFLFARPSQFHRLSSGFGQARSLYRGFTGMLAAIGRSCIRHDDADVIFGNMKCLR